MASNSTRKPSRGRQQSSKPGPVRQDENVSLTDSAVQIIRDRILDLTLAPGIRIDDKLLMKQFGMGRTPAREAFNRIAAEGLIIIQRNRGAFVRPLDIHHVRQLFDAYGAMERVIGHFCRTDQPGLLDDLMRIEQQYEASQRQPNYLDMTRLNTGFHMRIAAATENEYIVNFSTELYNHARRLSYFIYLTMGFKNTESMQDQIVDHHKDIVESIRHEDNAALVACLTEHAIFFHQSIISSLGGTRGFDLALPTITHGVVARRRSNEGRPESMPAYGGRESE